MMARYAGKVLCINHRWVVHSRSCARWPRDSAPRTHVADGWIPTTDYCGTSADMTKVRCTPLFHLPELIQESQWIVCARQEAHRWPIWFPPRHSRVPGLRSRDFRSGKGQTQRSSWIAAIRRCVGQRSLVSQWTGLTVFRERCQPSRRWIKGHTPTGASSRVEGTEGGTSG